MDNIHRRSRRKTKALFAVVLVGGSLFLANVVGFRSGGATANQNWQFGWPGIYKLRPCMMVEDYVSLDLLATSRFLFNVPCGGGDTLNFSEPLVLSVNVYFALIITGCTYFVLVLDRFSAFPRQWTLRQFLVVMGLISLVLGLCCSGPFPWWPAMTWKPLLFFPILFGLACTALAADSVIARLVGSVRGKHGLHHGEQTAVNDSPEGPHEKKTHE